MGRVNNALCMLAMLKSGFIKKRRDIAEALEVTVREVSRYKEDLEMAGVQIREVKGRYGGYQLEVNNYLSDVGLNKEEEVALQQAVAVLNKQKFIYKKELLAATAKILGAKKEGKKNYLRDTEQIVAKTSGVVCNVQEEKQKWAIINEAKIFSYKLKICYMDTRGAASERIIHPYRFYVYNSANYLVGYCEKRQAIRQFKLIRIQTVEIIKEKFVIDQAFDPDKYLAKALGLYKDETLAVKLKILYPYANYFKEVQWVEEEEIEDHDEEGYLIYQATMEGKTQIKSWIMQMHTNCIVLEPQHLKEEIKKIYKKGLANY